VTLTDQPALRPFTTVVHDIYRNVHKGIRSDLFTVTHTAGRIDPGDRLARVELADQIGRSVARLELHAHHEDAVILPALEAHLPDLAETIASDHVRSGISSTACTSNSRRSRVRTSHTRTAKSAS